MHNIRVERRKLHQFTKPVTFRFTTFDKMLGMVTIFRRCERQINKIASVTVYLPATKTIALCDAY